MEEGVIIVEMETTELSVIPKGKVSNIIEMYEYLAKEKAPESLTKAYNKLLKNREENKRKFAISQTKKSQYSTEAIAPNQDLLLSRGSDEAPRDVEKFKNLYCNSNGSGDCDFYFCRTEKTGDATYTFNRIDKVRAIVRPYRGSVRIRLKYRRFGRYRVFRDRLAKEGKTKDILYVDDMYFGGDKIKVSIYRAEDNGYNFAVYGLEDRIISGFEPSCFKEDWTPNN